MSYKIDKLRKKLARRSTAGNILILSLVILGLLVALFLALPWKVAFVELCHAKHANAVQSASLAAASELSKIVINDPYFGYVGLSDSVPSGAATVAGDGEATPVVGINTLIGSARLDLILAHILENNELIALAEQDAEAARKAARRLETAWKKAIDPGNREVACDLNGKLVKPYELANEAYMSSIGWSPLLANHVVQKFSLSLGWVEDGGSSTTLAPLPEELSETPADLKKNGCYKPFEDIPAFGESFYFVGVGPQPALVSSERFKEPDGKRICSIVKVEADVESKAGQVIANAACAQPYAVAEANPAGVMRINFSNGLPPNVSCLRELISDARLNVARAEEFTASGGDVPVDQNAVLVQANSQQGVSVAQVLARGLYDWIRTAHVRLRLDSVIAMMDQSLSNLAQKRNGDLGDPASPSLLFEFDAAGNVLVRNCNRNPFISEIVDENQSYAVNYQPVQLGSTLWNIGCRDEVRKLGSQAGGKHAGQPVVGNPVNWCELAYFDGSSEASMKRAKGGKALGLVVTGSNQGCAGGEQAVSQASAQFSKLDGGSLSHAPRKSYYSGGLAVDIEMSQSEGADD
jgi:hypothetical protein